MEHNHGGLEDHFPFFSWVICRFQPLIFQGVVGGFNPSENIISSNWDPFPEADRGLETIKRMVSLRFHGKSKKESPEFQGHKNYSFHVNILWVSWFMNVYDS